MTMKYRLYAPGPTPVPEEALTEMAKPILHHRTPAFEAVIEEVRDLLKWLYKTKEEVLLFSSSGSGAMEASLINCMSKGDKALVVDGGKFGERWWKIAKAYGLDYEVIKVEWGQAVDPSIIEAKLKEDDYRVVCVQASETSTGVSHPIKEIADIVKKHDQTLLLVDGITAVGVMDLPVDDWGIDVLVAGSQKAFSLPPGLAFASVSQKAWAFVEKSDIPKFYFNFVKERDSILKNTTAWTPAVSLIMGLRVVLRRMKEEGHEAMYERHHKMGLAVREAAKACGLELFAPEAPSSAITAIWGPDRENGGAIVKYLRDKLNMTIAGGQEHAKGKIFRIGHLGYYDAMDMITVWSAIEMALTDVGYDFERGKGVAKAIEILG